MKAKTFFLKLLVLLGWLVILFGFYLFAREWELNLIVLNLVVVSTVYALYFVDFFLPISDFREPSKERVGGLGVRWVTTIVYTIFAIGFMAVANYFHPLGFELQLFVQAALFVLMGFGLYASHLSNKKAAERFISRVELSQMLDEIGAKLASMEDYAALAKFHTPFVSAKLKELRENARYISPSNNPKAIELEGELMGELDELERRLRAHANEERVIDSLGRCAKVLDNRSKTVSV